MRFSLLAVVGLVAGTVIAAPSVDKRYADHVVHEKRSTPANWRKSAKMHSDDYYPMRIALTQSNLDRADEWLMDVSHPSSEKYGKHWTAKQVAEAFAPSYSTISSVKSWLASAGIPRTQIKQSQSLNWLHVNTTIGQAESLLNTKFFTWKHKSGESTIACDSYSLPAHIKEHVDFITPTVHFDKQVKLEKKRGGLAKRQGKSAEGLDVKWGTGMGVGLPSSGSLPKVGGLVPLKNIIGELETLADCDKSIVPDCLRALYGIPKDFPAVPGNSYGIVEYTPQAYNPSDLDMFFRNFSAALVGHRPTFDSIDGGILQTVNTSFSYNTESDLDLEYAMSLVYPQKVTLYQTGDIIESASFNNFLDAIDGPYCTFDGGDDPTQDSVFPDHNSTAGYQGPENCGGFAATKVISTSYAYNEAGLTPFYEWRQCREYLKLGLQGVTFVYSSGDYGVAGNGGKCIDPATGDYNNGTSGTFNPSFPSTCPYITSIGATQVKPNTSILLPSLTSPEMAAESIIYSGGGFSNVFPLPPYQAPALSHYFTHHAPPYPASRYNNSQQTRGFPDISANGVAYITAVNGAFQYVYGTSASTPTVGALLTLINAQRMLVGKGSVGFVNPVLYANQEAFNDVRMGGNEGCGTGGFEAVEGWDPVTGLGTPDFGRLSAVFLGLP